MYVRHKSQKTSGQNITQLDYFRVLAHRQHARMEPIYRAGILICGTVWSPSRSHL